MGLRRRRIGVRRKQEDGHVGEPGRPAQPVAEGEAAHVGQHRGEQDEVGPGALGLHQRPLTFGDRSDGEARGLHGTHQQLRSRRITFHQEDVLQTRTSPLDAMR